MLYSYVRNEYDTNKTYSIKMKIITQLLSIAFSGVLLMSCSDSDNQIDNPSLMQTLQKQIDNVVSQNYQIDDVTIYSKSYSDEGPDHVGDFKFMYINAVSPDTTIEYMANFSYAGHDLQFHGYPVSPRNKVKTGMTYSSQPDLPDAITKLDDIKKMIPDGFRYAHLLMFKYIADPNGAFYEFKIEVTPKSDNLTHPNIRQEKKSYVKYSTSTTRRKFGTTQEKRNTDIKRKIEHTITFRLKDNQITIK